MPLTAIINVGSYGVVGDYNPATGVGTDDTAAIVAAFAAAKPGDMVVFPAPLTGRGFKVSSMITVNKTLNIEFNGAAIYLTGAVPGFKFDVGAVGLVANQPNIIGKRLAGQTGIVITEGHVKVLNGRIDLCDYAIDVQGGVWHSIDNMVTRNMLNGVVQIGNVVGTSVRNLTYDTDVATYAQPTFGIRIFGEGCRIQGCDIIHAGNCVLLETVSTRDCTWNMFSDCTFDTSTRGVLLRNYNAGRRLAGNFFNNCWSASHTEAAFQIDANQAVDGVAIKNCHIVNNAKFGIVNTGNSNNVDILGCEFGGNSTLTSGGYSNIYTNATGSKFIRSNTFGKFGGIGGQVSYDVQREVSDGNCVFSENWSDSGVAAGVVNGAGASALRYGINYGYASPSR